MSVHKPLNKSEKAKLLKILQDRFKKNMQRHHEISWSHLEVKVKENEQALRSLLCMESSGGEPDVIAFEKKCNRYFFVDCAPESPSGRRSLCYDRAGMLSRKEHLPSSTAMDMAAEMGVELLTQEQYEMLQTLGNFDTKTSSWLKTPDEMRQLGGALFGDRRFNRVFVYHNGAQSYYAGRGFRAGLWV